MKTEPRNRFVAVFLALAAGLLPLILLGFVPLARSVPKTVTMVDDTWSETWDGTKSFQKNLTFVLNATIPGNPENFELLPSLLESENLTFADYLPERPDPNRSSVAWVNLSFNGVSVVHGRNSHGGNGNYSDTCGVPCSRDAIAYNRALHEGTNEVRFDVSYRYESRSAEPVNVTANLGPIRVTMFEKDLDGDGVSDRYQVLPGVPAFIAAGLAALPAGAGAYLGARRWR
jgi:hypothetical protein